METIRVLLLKYLTAAWRHKWVALAAAWAICGIGWVSVWRMPNQYEASARLYVDADAVLTPLLRGLALDITPLSRLDFLQRTLLSRPNLEKLIAKTDLDLSTSGADDRERLVQQLSSAIRISPQTYTLFTISYRNSDPKLAYNVVQALLTQFMEATTGTSRLDMDNARRFLQAEINLYEQQLRDAERRRAEFRAKYAELLPADGGVSRLDSATALVKQLEGDITDTTQKRDALRQELANTPPLVVTENDTGPNAATVGPKVAALEQQLAELRMKYTDQHPDVLAMKRQIELLKNSSSAAQGIDAPHGPRSRSVPNPVYEQLKIRLLDAESTLASLQRRIEEATVQRDRLEAFRRAVPGIEAESQDLDRDYSVKRRNYEEFLARRETTTITQAADNQADKVKMEVIDPPIMPRLPVAPNRFLLMSTVLIGGLGAGGGLAVLLGMLDRSFRTVEDLRGLGLPVLGGISLLRARRSRTAMLATFSFCVGVLLLVAVYGGLISRASALT
jgi:polysaccharide chain length determinant protein (PEP-CTERM system associated)